jgi:PAS domain S-box-containing protein
MRITTNNGASRAAQRPIPGPTADRQERLADSLNDVIVEADAAGVVTYVSPSCRTVLGFDAQEIVGRPALEWVHEEDRSRVEEEHVAILESPQPVTSTYRCRRRDGTLAWIESVTRQQLDPNTGELAAVLGCCRDVTERRAVEERLRASEAMLADAQAVTHIGCWEWDVAGDEIKWSDELYRIFGLEPGEIVATYDMWLEQVHPEDRRLADETVRRALCDRKPYQFHHRVLLPGGEVRVVLGRGRVETDADGRVVRMVGTGQDVTGQHRIQRALVEARTELERSNRELELFAFDASHDLSEPLQVMSSAAAWLCDRACDCMGEEGRQMASSIVDGVDRMQTLISDLLEYSRVGAEPAPEPVDCAAVVAQATDILAETIAEKRASVSWGELPVIDAHPTQLIHVFQNLISNALKFTTEGAVPKVVIAASREQGAWRFTITDNGIGIDPCHRERVFEMFRRLGTRDFYAGTGIGLSLCRRIVERHSGRIWVEPAPGGGSVFSFTIPDSPAARSEPSTESASPGRAQSSSPRRIASATADARSGVPTFR